MMATISFGIVVRRNKLIELFISDAQTTLKCYESPLLLRYNDRLSSCQRLGMSLKGVAAMFGITGWNSRLKFGPYSASLLLFLILPASAIAQLGPNGIDDDPASGMRNGNNTIVGQLIFPAGRRQERRFTVRLSSVRVGEFSTMTDNNGVFTFRRLREGAYFITIDAGKEYVPAQETVDLFDNRPRTTTIQIELRVRPNVNAKPGVVNATFAGIPKTAIDLYQKGLAAAAAGSNEQAIESFKAALAIHPAFILALNELSAAYLNLNDLGKAQEALETALRYEPNHATLRLNYGYVLLLTGQVVESERQLRRAVQANSSSSMAHSYLGLLLIKLRRFDEAENELRQAIEVGGSAGITAYRYLGALYIEKGEISKAIKELEIYLKLAPNARDAEHVRAKVKELQEQLPANKQ